MQKLTTELKVRLKGAKKIAVLGVGSDLRGDDAAGILVAESIIKKTKKIKVFLGFTAPENLSGEIVRFKPSHIVIVDTADIKQKPGTVLLLNAGDLADGASFSTHKLPPKVMMDYFSKKLKCKIFILGIQPKSVKFDAAVSKEVKNSVKEVSAAIIEATRR
jgi:hydrogenase 3 maturation protease